MILAEFAPAKVNLFLHVGPSRADGYHPLVSLMVFADVGDRLVLEPSDRFHIVVDGPFAGHAPPGPDNLVARAASELFERADVAPPSLRLTLTKTLPAGAGLGGGSADAAAGLRLLRRAMELEIPVSELLDICARLGSDIPACLAAAPVMARGRGEVLSDAPVLPVLPAVLVRPDAGSATGPVYRAFDGMDPAGPLEPPPSPAAFVGVADVVAHLAACRNDLQAPAVRLEPRIGEALEALDAAPETLFSRMSGSGSACFGLCVDMAAAERLARTLRDHHPSWWVQPCRLGGPWS